MVVRLSRKLILFLPSHRHDLFRTSNLTYDSFLSLYTTTQMFRSGCSMAARLRKAFRYPDDTDEPSREELDEEGR